MKVAVEELPYWLNIKLDKTIFGIRLSNWNSLTGCSYVVFCYSYLHRRSNWLTVGKYKWMTPCSYMSVIEIAMLTVLEQTCQRKMACDVSLGWSISDDPGRHLNKLNTWSNTFEQYGSYLLIFQCHIISLIHCHHETFWSVVHHQFNTLSSCDLLKCCTSSV